nr:hypothetical protein [Shewanella shenzhenensis]
VLSRITIPTCDPIFWNPETRLLMHITGLLPWLGLQLTRLLLGRVLDTCALGRKRDHKRLVPLVANIG